MKRSILNTQATVTLLEQWHLLWKRRFHNLSYGDVKQLSPEQE